MDGSIDEDLFNIILEKQLIGVEKVLPELVVESDGVKSVSYGNIVGVLIEAIKEQQVRIEELERKLDA